MIRDKITLDQATELYSESFLTIYFPSTSLNDLPDIPNIQEYTQNYINYAKENKRSSIESLLSLLAPEYIIEVELPFDQETGTFSWARLFGVVNPDYKADTTESNHRGWVYLLTNPAYPDLIKIGKAVTPSKRIHGINSAGTVSEWELKAAMPVSDDYRVEGLVHNELQQYRRKSDQGSSREFFEVPMSLAIQTLLEVSKPFAVGDIKIY